MKPLAFALFVSAISPAYSAVTLINGNFQAQGVGNIGTPTSWPGSGQFAVKGDTGSYDGLTTNRYVTVRSSGDATISQSGTIDVVTPYIQLTGWFYGNGAGDDQATITLAGLDAGNAVLNSVTISSGATVGWQQINGPGNGLWLPVVANAVNWKVTLFYDNVQSGYASSRFDDLVLAPVPEPSGSVLFGLSGALLLFFRRRG